MSGEPSFSVVIAVHNGSKTVREAVDSALSQTSAPQQIIVCDDGSTDDIEGALAPVRNEIELIRQTNEGEGSAKNKAIGAATGEFVAILDADDIFLSRRLEAIGQLAVERPDLDIITTDAWLEVNGRRARRCYTPQFKFATVNQRVEILKRNFIFGHVAVRLNSFKAVGGFDPALRRVTDWDCWLRMIFHGARVGLVDEPLSVYRLSPTNLSSDRPSMARGREKVLTRALEREDLDSNEREVARSSLAGTRAVLATLEARQALLEGHGDARRRLLEIARSSGFPARQRAKALVAASWPAVARRLLRRGEDGSVETAAGLRVDPGSKNP